MQNTLILLLLLVPLLGEAQQDSLIKSSQEDKKAGAPLIRELIDWAEELRFTDPQKALTYLERAQEIATNRSDRTLQALVYQNMSIFYYSRGDFENALDCDKKTLNAYLSLNDLSGMAYAHNGIAVTLSDMGYYHEAINNYIEAELLMSQLADSTGLQMVYVNMGVALDYLRDYQGAIDLYHKSLNIALALNFYDELGDIFNNMAEAYMALDNHELAFGYYLKAREIYIKSEQVEGIVMIKGNLAEYYRITKDFVQAEPLFNQAIIEYGHLQNSYGKCINMLGLAKLYNDMGKHEKAKTLLEEVTSISKRYLYINELIEAQRALADANFRTKNYEVAYAYYSAYDALKDSIAIASKNVEYDRLRRSFEADKNQSDLEALQLQHEKDTIIGQQKDRWGYALIIIAFLLLGFSVAIVWFYYRLRKTNTLLQKNGEDLVLKNKEIEKQSRQLQVANAKLLSEKKLAEISSEAKAEFVSVLSHEIRTPLNAIIGLSHLLKTEVKSKEHRKHIDALSYSAENLMGFTTNILELSRLDAGRIEIQNEPFDLQKLLEQIKDTFEPILLEKPIRLDCVFEENVPNKVVGDRVRLTQILLNLISNAIKYTESGFVRVTIKNCATTQNKIALCFIVEDSGIGIDYELQERIFDRYSRLQNESTLTPQGTGLGLSIAKSLVELMGGTISFSSKPEHGSTFEVKLVFNKYATESKDLESITPVPIPDKSLKGRRVLLVEDNPVNILFTNKMLTNWGIITEVAENGQIAVDKCRESTFDLVLMDLQMPVMNGIDASTAISKFVPELPIIALTANADGDIQTLLSSSAMCDILEKPFRADELKIKLDKWLISHET